VVADSIGLSSCITTEEILRSPWMVLDWMETIKWLDASYADQIKYCKYSI
jgi:hypothetical protein